MSTEIKGLMNTSDMWHKRAMKTNDKLHWNAYRHFRQEVKREIRLAEKEHVRSENSQSIHSKENAPLATVENTILLANKFNEFFANVGTMTALKTTKLAKENNSNIHDTEGFDPCESDRNSGPNNTPLFAFQPLPQAMCIRLLRVQIKVHSNTEGQ